MADYFRPGTSGDIHLRYILLAHIIFVKEQFIFALVGTIVDAGKLFTTSKQTWLTRSRRFTAPRPIHLFEPPLMRRSSFPSVSHGLVYINIPGRTCLHELFVGYEQVTAWVARYSFKLEANYHQPPFALDGSMSRRTSRRHYSFG